MSKLQKSAWVNLIFTTVIIATAGLGFYVLTKMNVKGIGHVLIFLVTGSVSMLIFNIPLRKKRLEAGFDERERKMYARAMLWSYSILMLFLVCVCIIPFYVLGGQHSIPVYILPVILLASIFIVQFVKSLVILIQCMLEGEDGQQ